MRYVHEKKEEEEKNQALCLEFSSLPSIRFLAVGWALSPLL